MIRVQAPEGYEAVRYYVDATRHWDAAYRPIGKDPKAWWTVAYLTVGHAHMTTEELDSRAAAAVEHAIAINAARSP